MGFFKALAMCFGMFSVLPVPAVWEERYFCWVLPLFPLVGVALGGSWFALASVLYHWQGATIFGAALVFLLPIWFSGGVHLDGLMDTSDAIFSRAPLEKKKEILKDSAVGAFAVMSVAIYFLLGFGAVVTILEEQKFLGLLLIPVVSRCLVSILLLRTRTISQTGFAATFKSQEIKRRWMVPLVFLLMAVAFCWCNPMLWVPMMGVVVGGLASGRDVIKKMGGISGDLAGFILVVSETCGLIALALLEG